MLDIVRDSTFGLVVNAVTHGRVFPYPEQRSGFVLPERYSAPIASGSASRTPATGAHTPNLALSETATIVGDAPEVSNKKADANPLVDVNRALEAPAGPSGQSSISSDEKHADGSIEVSWYDDNDPENPYNWSSLKKGVVTGLIMLLTFSVYAGSSIYTPSIPGLMEAYGINIATGTAGLSLYIYGYAIGPLILSPLQELPKVGRGPVYIATLFIFMLFTLGSAVAKNIETVLVTRFFAGFFGSPALATGGASIADIFGNDPLFVPYAIALWAIGAVLGPVLSPFIGGFAADANGWRWPLWILVWLSGGALAILSILFPETQHANILHRRAKRLRQLTGNSKLSTEGEREQKAMTFKEAAVKNLARPILISLEPAPLLLGLHLGLCYALFYLFFESFPLVYGQIYGFNLGEQGLAFLGYLVTAILTYVAYAFYLKKRIEPLALSGKMEPEDRLEIGLIGAFLIPISSFFWGWTARASIHWIVPTIAAALYLPGLFIIFQSFLVYIGMSYQQYAASAYAGNTLLRSVIAAAFPLFGHHFYVKLGLGPGSSLLAGLSLVLIIPLWLIKRYGKHLRARSKYAPFTFETEATTTTTDNQDVEKGRAVPQQNVVVGH